MYLATVATRTFTLPEFLFAAFRAVAIVFVMIWVKLVLYRRRVGEDDDEASRLQNEREADHARERFRRGYLVRAFYYTAIFEDQEYVSIRPLIDWLAYNGFTVVTKPAKEFDDGGGRRKFKRSMRVELAVDALEIANQVDDIMLFSGDGDFCSLLEAVQRRGVHVTVISSLRSKPPMVADELRRQADTFIELDDLKAAIGRTSNTVPPRAA